MQHHYCICSWVFVYRNIIFFYGKALAIVTKCSILDVAGVLNPCQYEHGLHMEITLFKF